MFQAPRQLFHRSSSTTVTTASGSDGTAKGAASPQLESSAQSDRHPAMRGLNVSPVHGRHCICARCDKPHDNAA